MTGETGNGPRSMKAARIPRHRHDPARRRFGLCGGNKPYRRKHKPDDGELNARRFYWNQGTLAANQHFMQKAGLDSPPASSGRSWQKPLGNRVQPVRPSPPAEDTRSLRAQMRHRPWRKTEISLASETPQQTLQQNFADLHAKLRRAYNIEGSVVRGFVIGLKATP